MKKFYISHFNPLSVFLLLLFTVQLQLSEAFGAVQQDDALKFSTKELKSNDHLNSNAIFRQKMAGRSAQKRNRPLPDSLRAIWLEKTIAASKKRHPAKSLAEMRAASAQAPTARESATAAATTAAVPPVLYVNVNKDDGLYNGTSWENAYTILADALKYAHENPGVQQIWVANGIYYPYYDYDYNEDESFENYTFRLVPNVKMYGGFTGVEQSLAERKLNNLTGYGFGPPDDSESEDLFTVLDGDYSKYHTVMSAGNVGSASLDGFMIREGNAVEESDASVDGMTIPRNAGGGIVVVNSSPTLSNLLITNNNGGGVVINNSSPSLSNLVIFANTAENGAGLFINKSSPKLTNLQILGNHAESGSAIYASQSSVVLTNSFINNNRADRWGAVYLYNSTDVLTNITITDNSGEMSSGLVVDGGAPKIRNTIITLNRDNLDIQVHNGGVPSFAHCIASGSGGSGSWNDAFGNDLGGNLDVAPKFYYSSDGLFGLLPDSPAINKGNNLYFQSGQTPNLSGLTTDQRGTTRITKGTVDIGAIESFYDILETKLTPNGKGILFVKKGGTGTKSGYDWNNAAPELADALFAVNLLPVHQIWVAGGIYHPLYRPDDLSNANPKSRYNSFLLTLDTEVYGGFKGDEASLEERDLSLKENASILSGDFNGDDNFSFTDLYKNGIKSVFSENARHVVYGFDLFSNHALDGFTIEGANNTSAVPGEMLFINAIALPQEYGSGIFIQSTADTPVFENLVIRNNLGSKGGGFTGYNSRSVIKNSVIYHNYDNGQGSGILASEGRIEIVNTTVAQNLSVPGPTAAGVASVGDSWVTISNSIISNNILLGEASPQANLYSDEVFVIENSIVVGSRGSANWQYGNFYDEGGNLDEDPQFVDMNAGDFSLAECSRAIDAGNIELYDYEEDIPVKDLAGNSRIFISRIDMGAFEYQSERSLNATALAGNAKTSSFTFTDVEGNAMHTFTANADVCDSDLLTLIPDNLSGVVTAKVWLDPQVNSYGNAVYLQRHFDIIPADNAASATGRVVLYFSQAEFDALNLKLTAPQYLPTGLAEGEDERKANLRIYQFHGESSNGSGSPSSYRNARTVIDPNDEDIKWNAALSRWEVAFFVEGFSGFFAGTVTQNPLPVRLISFEGKQTDDQKVKLDWKVAEQENIQVYEVEYSNNGKTFTRIGLVNANVLTSTDYSYTDSLTHAGDRAYYRLKILEFDGKTAYSRLISIKLLNNGEIVAYPVPAKNELWIDWKNSNAASADFIDSNGRILKTIRKVSASQKVDISGLPVGLFLLKADGNNVLKVVKE